MTTTGGSDDVESLVERLHRFGVREDDRIVETTGMLVLGDHRLLFVIAQPKSEPRPWGLVICPSMFEFSRFQPTEVAFLRLAAAEGFPGIYLEPPGMGDSEGEFEDCTVGRRIDAALGAFESLQSQIGDGAIHPCWFGARLGGAVAVLAAERWGSSAALIAWDLVVDGEDYWSQARRLARVTAVAQKNRSFKDPEESLEASGRASVLWLPMTRELRGDLRQVNRVRAAREIEGPALLVATNDELLHRLREGFTGPSERLDLVSLGRDNVEHLGVAEAAAAIEPSLTWMSERLL